VGAAVPVAVGELVAAAWVGVVAPGAGDCRAAWVSPAAIFSATCVARNALFDSVGVVVWLGMLQADKSQAITMIKTTPCLNVSLRPFWIDTDILSFR
jgi:hypothetical protein